jgi:pimeloyl-ACP methyl ester carboxylesterase
MGERLELTERITAVGVPRVRSLVAAPPAGSRGPDGGPDRGLVVILPGLGLPGYTLPTASAIAASGVECAVLDLPGYGSSQPATSDPDVHEIGKVAHRWVLHQAAGRPVVIMGHSTGAQAALTAALALQDDRQEFALVLAGPTFRPEHRQLPRLLWATPFAYRNDSPAELDVREILRARLDLARILRSGMRDAPESRIRQLRAPVTITAGTHDAYSPADWLEQLANAATNSAHVRTAVIDGSHNNLYTHPAAIADLAVLALRDTMAWPAAPIS